MARQQRDQAAAAGRNYLAETWTRKPAEAEKEADVIRSSMRRVDELAAQFAQPKDA